MMAQCMLRGISIHALAVCWALSLLFTLLAVIHVGGRLVAWTIAYSMIFMIIMRAIDRLKRVTFVRGRAMLAAVGQISQHELELAEVCAENKRIIKEKEMAQLHSLMGNVAHDLKTPLHSIEADLDILRTLISKIPSNVIEKARAEIMMGSRADVDPQYIFSSLAATCKFMTMSINRSQDFMKAGNKIALVPMMETFAIASSLEMAVTCMSHLSSRTIVVHPVDKDICAHIISDQHWLSENVLCLLSNAIKYSDDGVVDVRISLMDAPISSVGNTRDKTDSSRAPTAISRRSTHDGKVSEKKCVTHYVGTQRSNVEYSDHKREMLDRSENLRTRLVSDPGEVRDTRDTRGRDREQLVCVAVEDCGIGITDDARKDLFQPFKQAQKKAGGTGLGLYSLLKRVEALGGKCGAGPRSDGSEGSTFWFTFPYRPDETAFADSPLTVEREGQEEMDVDHNSQHDHHCLPPLQHSTPEVVCRSILVIDDSLAILKVTARMLEMKGHTVETASNGHVGLRMLKESLSSRKYDMVLTDIQMPVMDGIEATRRFREFEVGEAARMSLDQDSHGPHGSHGLGHKRLLIVGMSANSDMQSKQEALDSGMDYFITKPFSYADFCLTTSATYCHSPKVYQATSTSPSRSASSTPNTSHAPSRATSAPPTPNSSLSRSDKSAVTVPSAVIHQFSDVTRLSDTMHSATITEPCIGLSILPEETMALEIVGLCIGDRVLSCVTEYST